MKPIFLLKKLITLFYYILGFGLIGQVISIIIKFFKPKMIKPPFLISEELYSSNLMKVMAVEILYTSLLFAFFRAIELIVYSLDDLAEGNHFSLKVIKNFKNSGRLFIALGISELIAKIITNYIFLNQFIFKVDSSIILFPIIGLFFLYLSEVFSEAQKIQSENELTV